MPQDTRRSRMRRTPRGKRLLLTARDLAILRALNRYRYLRSTYLHAFAGGASETRFKERLGDLFHEGYLNRPEAQWRFADCRNRPAVYELGRNGIKTLKDRGEISDERRVLLGPDAHRQFEHGVMICEALASIELAIANDPGLGFIPLPAILAKAPDVSKATAFCLRLPDGTGRFVVPDAVFGIAYLSGNRPSYRFFALEADRGTMPVRRVTGGGTSLAGKLCAYRAGLARDVHRNLLGVPNLLVLVLTTTKARSAEASGSTAADPRLLFKAIGPEGLLRPASGLLLDP